MKKSMLSRKLLLKKTPQSENFANGLIEQNDRKWPVLGVNLDGTEN